MLSIPKEEKYDKFFFLLFFSFGYHSDLSLCVFIFIYICDVCFFCDVTTFLSLALSHFDDKKTPRSLYLSCAVFDVSISHWCQMRELFHHVFNLLFFFVLTWKIRYAYKKNINLWMNYKYLIGKNSFKKQIFVLNEEFTSFHFVLLVY